MTVIGATLLLVSGVAWTVLRFMHPDMTETRLLVTYWYLVFPTVAGALLFGYGMNKEKTERGRKS